MDNNKLKKVFDDVHIKDDMQQRLIDNCRKFENRKNFKEEKKMKKFNKAIVAAMVAVVGFTTVVYGEDIYNSVRELFLGDYAHYISNDYVAPDVPEDVDLIITDNGNFAVVEFGEEGVGNTSVIIEDAITIFETVEDAQPNISFELQMPEYLPDGYAFDKIELYKNENGIIDGQYASVYFSKGEKYIYLQARLMNEETAFVTGMNGLSETEVNGYKALISEDSIDVDIDGVLYMFMAGPSDVKSDELVKMVESLK